MMQRHIALGVLFLIAVPAVVASQIPDPIATAMTAHGGTARLAAIQGIRIKGQATRMGVSAAITISARTSGEVRIDYDQPLNRSFVNAAAPFEIADGKQTFKQPHTGAFGRLDLLSILGVAPYLAATKTFVGRTSAPSGMVDRYEARTSDEKVFYRRTLEDRVKVDFDTGTGRIAGIARQQFAEQSLDHPFTLSHAFSDYRVVNGVVLPFRIDIAVDGNVKETILVDSIQLNPIFLRDLFER